MSLARFSYSCLLYGLLPFTFIKLWWRGRLNPDYRQAWGERLGYVKAVQSPQPCICLHAVSVGETMAARPLIEQLLIRYPEYKLWITSTTPTGAATVERLLGTRVERSYLPYDTPAAVQRFLRKVQPQLLLIMETELWPNLYAACAEAKIPLVVVNARLSERSARGYARIQGLTRETLANISLLAAREQQDAERFLALGAVPKQLKVLGNIKFDAPIATELRAKAIELRGAWGERLVWVAASTHRGEDELILQAHQELLRQFPHLLLILVPRHPERFVEVAVLCEQAQLKYQRRSSAQALVNTSSVLLGDSMGELLIWYACADVAFVGGSLVDVGGHNPLEALAFGVPVISGHCIHNFQDIYPNLVERGAVVLVDSPALLAHHLAAWLAKPAARHQAGQVGQRFLEQQRGVVTRLLPDLDKLLNAEN
ncbi:lipid IV(A) 3-deoxy-D-manno-octulosonic acid transferase [uncultured Thiothrix sp.]|uniref:lipid IV(A) 3-deoxy-D-manno-octulosonic acid transferase n=1 Tax=uncultured Thiothrix sp. TaxID=223185 RepID=UPI0026140CA6|nr:lipid IV(A) 3-deoxy-D-manno-octulosonic acid transferase [uncultured Thiothrix sp.]HMT93313.1 lipid IV(A) 3-deoxy-D-manno-octulosonic acid transferase [Thiolinea sp.]